MNTSSTSMSLFEQFKEERKNVHTRMFMYKIILAIVIYIYIYIYIMIRKAL